MRGLRRLPRRLTGDRGEAQDSRGSADAHDRWGMYGRCPFVVRLRPSPYRVSMFVSSIQVSNRADLSRHCTAHHWSEFAHLSPTGAPTHATRRFAPRVEHRERGRGTHAGNPGLVHPGEASSVTRPAANRRQRSNRVSIPDASTDAHGGLEDEDRPHDAHDVGNPVRHRTEGRQYEEDVGRDL